MKALIVEIRGNSAAALCENSGIVKIPNKGYSVGQQVNIVAKKKSVYRLSAAVACIAMFFGLSTTGYAAFTPYSYVTLDVNPSFEYTLNRFDQVIGVESVNDDAEAVLNEIDIPKFRNIDEVIKLTIDELYNEGYLTGDEKEIMLLSVCGGDDGKTKDLAEKLTDVTTAYEATPDILEVTEDDRKAADDLNTTAGKLALILDIVNKTDKVTEADVEKYVDKSVKEIIAVLDNKTKNLLLQTQQTTSTKKTVHQTAQEAVPRRRLQARLLQLPIRLKRQHHHLKLRRNRKHRQIQPINLRYLQTTTILTTAILSGPGK